MFATKRRTSAPAALNTHRASSKTRNSNRSKSVAQHTEPDSEPASSGFHFGDYVKADYSNMLQTIDTYPDRDEIRVCLNGHAIELLNTEVLYQNSHVHTKRTLRGLISTYMTDEDAVQKFAYVPLRRPARSGVVEKDPSKTSCGRGSFCFFSDNQLVDNLKHMSTCVEVSKGAKLYIHNADAVVACTANLSVTYHLGLVKSGFSKKTNYTQLYIDSRAKAQHAGFAWVTTPNTRVVTLAKNESAIFNPDSIVMAKLDVNVPLPEVTNLFKMVSSKRGWQKFHGPCDVYLQMVNIKRPRSFIRRESQATANIGGVVQSKRTAATCT
jgi:hypothetical protein